MENQRIRISKRMLKNALLQLLKEIRIEKITIYELCRKAEVNRTTFYKYYGSQYDLLDDIQNEFFETLESYIDEADMRLSYTRSMLEYLWNNRELCTTLINAVSDGKFIEKLFQRPNMEKMIIAHISDQYAENMRPYILLYYNQGCYSIIRHWLNEENPVSIEEINNLLTNLSKTTL